MVWCYTQVNHWSESLTLLPWDAVGVFYSLGKLVQRTLVWVGVLPLCRNGVGVFYSPSRVGNRTLVRVCHPHAEMQLVYTAPADLVIRQLLGWGSYPFAEMQSVCSTAALIGLRVLLTYMLNDSKRTRTRWRDILLWHCRMCSARGHISTIPAHNLPRLRTSGIDRFNE